MNQFRVYEKGTGKTVTNVFQDCLGSIYKLHSTGKMCDCGCLAEYLELLTTENYIFVWGDNLYDDMEKKGVLK